MTNRKRQWHVVRILSETALIIDAGKNAVFPDDKIQVYEVIGSVEGVNGENLGPLIYVKAELRVKQVEDNYSICETPTFRASTDNDFASILQKKISSTKHFRMQVDSNDIVPAKPKNQNVCIGDLVKRL